MAKRPQNIKVGDTIGIISTARKVNPKEMLRAIELFESWGLKVCLGENLYSEENQFSGTEQQQIDDLQNMIDNSKVKAIVCARGGYGTTRIIDRIDFSVLLNDPKWVVGFSDITALHCHLHQLGLESIHGIMPILFDQDGVQSSIESLKRLLFGEEGSIECVPHPNNRIGICEAPIIGGNLSIINNLIGTKSGINTTGKILFIEEIDEYLYHIDRMLVQLKRAGMLKGLAGLVVGYMTDMNDNNIPFGKSVNDIILDHVKEYNFPVCFEFPLGHEIPNMAIPCSRMAKLDVKNEKVELIFDL